MLSKSIIWRRIPKISATKRSQRHSSFLSVHTSFPATMYRFQLQRGSSLFNNKMKDGGFFRDAVVVADDGLIYPMLSNPQNRA
jgi:hypothetical protein